MHKSKLISIHLKGLHKNKSSSCSPKKRLWSPTNTVRCEICPPLLLLRRAKNRLCLRLFIKCLCIFHHFEWTNPKKFYYRSSSILILKRLLVDIFCVLLGVVRQLRNVFGEVGAFSL